MRNIIAILAFGLCIAPAVAQAQSFEDQFDSYSPGLLAAQSLWEEWSGSVGVDPSVVDLTGTGDEFTPPHCVLITGQPVFGTSGNDVVWDFTNSGGQPTSGKWLVSTRVMVPAASTGIGWFIMLNEYPASLDWSLQFNFDATNGQVIPVEPVGTTVPLITDTWVDLVVAIDLDNNRVSAWYGNMQIVSNKEWIGTGSRQIAAIDLYGGEPTSGGISELYYDCIRMDKNVTAGGYALAISDGPVPDGGTVNIDIRAPSSPNDNGLLFVTEAGGVPFIRKVLRFSLDNAGEWNMSAQLAPGFSGLDINMWSFALTGGQLRMSNISKLVIQ